MVQVLHTSQHPSTGQGRLAFANTCKQNFVLIAPSMRVPNMAVQQAEGGWQWQTHLETGFCPHHQALA